MNFLFALFYPGGFITVISVLVKAGESHFNGCAGKQVCLLNFTPVNSELLMETFNLKKSRKGDSLTEKYGT